MVGHLQIPLSLFILLGQFQSLLSDNLEYLIIFKKLLQQQMINDSSPPAINEEIELL